MDNETSNNFKIRFFAGLKASYAADLAHIDKCIEIREEDVARLKAQRSEVMRRLAEIDAQLNELLSEGGGEN